MPVGPLRDALPMRAWHRRRATSLCIECELIEARQAQGEGFDVDAYCKVSNTLARLFCKLGLETNPSQVQEPVESLEEYVARREREQGQAA